MDTDEVSRRRFLGGAATAGAAVLGGIALMDAREAQAATPAGLPEPQYFDDPSGARIGLRWAFSAVVFFADRVMLNTMPEAAGRGYTSVGGGEIWGPRLKGRVLPHSGADYYKAGFNTYYMFEAGDGAQIFIHNRGTMRRFARPWQPGVPLADPPAHPSPDHPVWTRFRATPTFTAPKGPHDWLNRTVFVADARRQPDPDRTVFTYYEVL